MGIQANLDKPLDTMADENIPKRLLLFYYYYYYCSTAFSWALDAFSVS
jgi:hypothetical protein